MSQPIDVSTVTNGMQAAQLQASIEILLPALLQNANLFTDATINEWNMFKPLASTFALQFAPQTAFTSPLAFIDWISLHPEFKTAKDYIKHLNETINSKNAADAANLIKMVTWLDAIQTANSAGVPPLNRD